MQTRTSRPECEDRTRRDLESRFGVIQTAHYGEGSIVNLKGFENIGPLENGRKPKVGQCTETWNGISVLLNTGSSEQKCT